MCCLGSLIQRDLRRDATAYMCKTGLTVCRRPTEAVTPVKHQKVNSFSDPYHEVNLEWILGNTASSEIQSTAEAGGNYRELDQLISGLEEVQVRLEIIQLILCREQRSSVCPTLMGFWWRCQWFSFDTSYVAFNGTSGQLRWSRDTNVSMSTRTFILPEDKLENMRIDLTPPPPRPSINTLCSYFLFFWLSCDFHTTTSPFYLSHFVSCTFLSGALNINIHAFLGFSFVPTTVVLFMFLWSVLQEQQASVSKQI